ncbi:MAG: ferredoxin-thioredoxin reductase catalytic domain-containing protein [Dehalococcoidia bacterium]|nr:ferredoxin-thioredoxin reductase catalytic domain-containing protein [Dehalococcoidia bacterium]
MGPTKKKETRVDTLYDLLKSRAESGGYHLNPDSGFTRELVKGLSANEQRYGYRACPCRLASGSREEDNDIICPCDYRDADLEEYGCCYCGLYVSRLVAQGKKDIAPIPERRPPAGKRQGPTAREKSGGFPGLPLPVWRCRVCGYLCARDAPPENCPICKAEKERFEKFI